MPQSRFSARLCSSEAPRPRISGGCLRTRKRSPFSNSAESFDLILELGADPPYCQDWLDLEPPVNRSVAWEQDFAPSVEHDPAHGMESLPVIALESMIVDRRRDLKGLVDRYLVVVGGWERLGELLQLLAAPPQILQPSGDRTL